MANTHRVIPIFIPEKACPYRCVYCNQFAIAGQVQIPMPYDVDSIIRQHLSTMSPNIPKRIAFFGGSFTGMTIEEQNEYLNVATPYLQQGIISGIQLSTRPDYISVPILENLKNHGVTLIELGAQSLDDDILRRAGRGHTVQQVAEASQKILDFGFELGLQMMIGLPGDTKEKSIETAKRIAGFGATCTRIYPTLVVRDTILAKMYQQGKYQPLSIEEAVDWCKELYQFFTNRNITILRTGLHPSEGLLNGTDYIAGPFHISFKELVLTAIWRDRILQLLDGNRNAAATIEVPAAEINYAVGYGSANKKAFPNVVFNVIK